MHNVSCRRQLLLAHFSEEYAKENCGACDFCKQAQITLQSSIDITIDAQNALTLLQQMRRLHLHWTETQLAEAIFGKETEKRFKEHGVMALKGFGCKFSLDNGQNATIPQIQELILLLIQKGVIKEYPKEYTHRFCYYIEV